MRKPVYYKLVLQLIQPFKIIVGLDQIKVPVTSSLYISVFQVSSPREISVSRHAEPFFEDI